MKNKIFCILIFILSLNAYSQDITKINIQDYKLDSKITSLLRENPQVDKNCYVYGENNHIYVLGWSKDGKLAFVQDKGVDGRGGHDLIFSILDMVEDKICYEKVIDWYDNKDEESGPAYGLTFEECLKQNSDLFNKELKKYQIFLSPSKTNFLPVQETSGTVIEFKIENGKKYIGKFNLYHMDYDIVAIKDGKKKTLSKVRNKLCEYVMPTAYIKSPYEERIALIVADAEYVFEGEEIFVNFYGCNLKTGFSDK